MECGRGHGYTAAPMTRAPSLRRTALCGLVLGLLPGSFAACRLADAKIWNLREVHRPDGRTKYVGRLHSDVEHVLRNMFEFTNFRGGAPAEAEKKVEDPLGECLDNLIELADCGRDDARILFAMVEVVSWLAKDCEYPLSRERCALELASLGERLGLAGPIEAPAEAAGVEPVSTAIEDLTRGVVDALASDASRPGGLKQACEGVRALALDREGARRLLSVANLLLDRVGAAVPAVRDLVLLRAELGRRCAGLALADVLVDPRPRVRAAALRTALALEPRAAAKRLEAGLDDEGLEVKLVAVRSLGRLGVPESEGADGRDEAHWVEKLIELLRGSFDEELSVALCRTLARWTGRPENLHPEAWVEWWEDEGRSAVPRP